MRGCLGARWLAIVCALAVRALWGTEPYQVNVTVGTASVFVDAPNLKELNKDLSDAALAQLIPVYTPTSAATFDLNLRGLLGNASFAAGSNTLVLSLPNAGINQSFTGTDRATSLELMRDYIRDLGDGGALLRAYARYSPIDPIAGNPNSLMANMGTADYNLWLSAPQGLYDCTYEWQPCPTQVQLGVTGGRAFSGGFDTTAVTALVRVAHLAANNYRLLLDMPMTYLRNGGASSFSGSVGLGCWVPVWCCPCQEWFVIPVGRVGLGGSSDLCTAGSFLSAGLTSVYYWETSDCLLTLVNHASYIGASNLVLSGTNFNYGVDSVLLKNGMTYTSRNLFLAENVPMNYSMSIIDTYYTNDDDLYINHWDEINFSVITSGCAPGLAYDTLTVGFTFQYGGEDYKGYFANIDYQF